MSLIYRGQSMTFVTRPVQSRIKPLAVNWRYQIAGEAYSEQPVAIRVAKAAKAVSWRWQVAAAN